MLEKKSGLNSLIAAGMLFAFIGLQACSEKETTTTEVMKNKTEVMQKTVEKVENKVEMKAKPVESSEHKDLKSKSYVHGYYDFLVKNIKSTPECKTLLDSISKTVEMYDNNQASGDTAVNKTIANIEAVLVEPLAKTCIA